MRPRRAAAAAVLAVALGVAASGCGGGSPAPTSAPADTGTPDATATATADLSSFGHLPPVPPPAGATVSCQYASGGPAARAVSLPRATGVPSTGTVAALVDTSQGRIGLTLDRRESPCTVNAFLSLAAQHFFDRSGCHRLSTTALKLLQCGDPTGTGRGGPGYTFPNEYPTTTYAPDNPAIELPVVYPRGTVAMANDGTPGTNGSQFFLVYADSPLAPLFTVFGTVSDSGLGVLDKVAAAGQDGSLGDAGGRPTLPVTITGVF
jgi:peptidylprolyl isomerase/peptidyl-prolyl cis-trans isomerase B (cyclophilin B)